MNRYNYIDEKNEHLHTLDEKPLIGTSTVVKMLGGDKTGGLMWWAAGMALTVFGWTTAKVKDAKGRVIGQVPVERRLAVAEKARKRLSELKPKEYLQTLDEAYKAHDAQKKAKGVVGTDRHEVLEKYVKSCIKTNNGSPLDVQIETIQPFINWAIKNVKRFLWSEAHCYSEELWTGGIADVGWEDVDNRIIAGDFKSSREAYLDQFVQIAGYDIQITENGAFNKEGEKIFALDKPIAGYCVIPFGNDELTPEFEWDLDKYKIGFKSALNLHKLSLTFKK